MTGRTGERGQVLPLVAICLTVLMGFAAMAVDVGYLQYQQRQQQSAADAAALAGARQLIADCSNSSGAQNAAYSDAASNGYTNGSGSVVVTVNSPATTGSYAGVGCTAQVHVASNHSTFFARLLSPGWNGQITTDAVAISAAGGNECIYVLDNTQQFQLNGTTLTAPTCGVMADSQKVQINGGTIDVDAFGYAGTVQSSGVHYTLASPQQMLPVADPCSNIAGCAYLKAHPPSSGACSSLQLTGKTATINPGCYSGIQIDGTDVTMNPGLYELTGQLQINGGSLAGTGVTVYMANGGSLQSNGNPLTLIAPTSGNYANVAYYQVPTNTTMVQYNGTNSNIQGLLYAPAAEGQVNGVSGAYVVLVFGTIQLNGSLSLVGPSQGQSIIKEAILVQ